MNFIAENTALYIMDCGSWFYVLKKACVPAEKGAIAFRADMDAVCGKDGIYGHYCGHDGHSSILAGLALALDGAKTNRDVYLIFQPGEETGEGARICLGLIDEKNIEEIYGLHNIPGYALGNILVSKMTGCENSITGKGVDAVSTFACASTGIEISMQGTPSHAAYPEAGKNPGLTLARLLLQIEELTKQVNEHEGFVLMTLIGIEAGSKSYGVSASKGVLRLTVRGESEHVFDKYLERIKLLAIKAADTEGLELEIKEIERFPATENYRESAIRVRACADKLGFTVKELKEPMRWSEDFGWYLTKTKGAFFGIGDGEDYAQLHTQEYEFPDKIMNNAIKLFAELV